MVIEGIVAKMIKELINIHGNISTQELAERIGVSVSSVKHNINPVREVLAEEGVELLSIPQKGLMVKATQEQRKVVEQILQWHINKNPASDGYRRDYIFKTVFYYNGNYTIQLLAEELYVSRNIIIKDIQFINDFLKKFRVKIEYRRNSGITIEGHEMEIRQAILLYNNQKWWNEPYLEVPDELDERISQRAWTFYSIFYNDEAECIWRAQTILLEIERRTERVFTDVALSRLLEYLLLLYGRVRRGKKVISHLNEERAPLDQQVEALAKELLPTLFAGKEKDLEIEAEYFAAALCVADSIAGSVEIEKLSYRNEIKEYLQEVGNAVGWYFDLVDDQLIDEIEDVITKISLRNDYGIIEWDNFSREIKGSIVGLYAMCMVKSYMLEDATGLKFRKESIARFALLIYRRMKTKRKEVVILTASNDEVNDYNLMKLKEEFPYLRFNEMITWGEYHREAYRDKIVLSTVRLKNPQENELCITKHVGDADIQSIKKMLLDNDRQKRENFLEVFHEELIFNIVAKNKEDALRQIADEMEEHGYVEGEFYEEVMKREEIMATSIGNSVAIPHGYKTGVLKSGVAVARLKNSVEWSITERIDIVFMFAIGKENPEKVRKIFEHMYDLLQEEHRIQKIREADSKDTILKLILT